MAQLVALGRTLLSPFTGAASWYNRTAERAPFTTGVVTTGIKTSVADLFAQKVVERREDIDWKVSCLQWGGHRCIQAVSSYSGAWRNLQPPLTARSAMASSPHLASSTWAPSNTTW